MNTGASYVRLLGHPAAERSGQPLRGLERNPKKLAVLAYLAVQSAQKFVTREALLAIFWSESAEKPARHALSQTLHFIRQHLGSDALLISGANLLKLNAALVDVDVRQFELALDGGDVERACILYRGELLEGLIVEGEAADWLDRERQRLRLRAAQAFWRCALMQLRAGQAEKAVHSAQHAIECDPTAEAECTVFLGVAVEERQFGIARSLASFFTTTLARATGGDTPTPAFLAHVHDLECSQPAAAVPVQPLSVRERRSEAPPTPLPTSAARPWVLTRIAAFVAVTSLAALGIWALTVKPSAGSVDLPLQQLVISEATAPERELESLLASTVDVIAGRFNRVGWQVVTGNTKSARRDQQVLSYALEIHAVRGDTGIVFTYRVRDPISETVLASSAVSFGPKLDIEAAGTRIADSIRFEIGNKQPMFASLANKERADLQRVWRQSVHADSLRENGALIDALRAHQVCDSMFAETDWTTRTRLIAGLRHLKQLESFASVEFMLDQPARADSVLARAEQLATGLVKRYEDRPEPREARGSVRFLKTYFSAAPTLAMLDAVEADLRPLVDTQRGSSTAFARLSVVLEMKGEYRSALVIANAAADRDFFLANDREILNRLFSTSFNAGEDDSAERYCSSLEDRYPRQTPSSVCRLLLMGWSERSTMDTVQALRIVREGADNEPEPMRKQTLGRLQALQAGVLARLGRTDEGLQLLHSLDHATDVELKSYKAAAFARLGDMQAARALAAEFARRNEVARVAINKGRIYRGLLE